MRFEVVTLFPELVAAVGRFGVVGRAVERGLLQLGMTDPREFATDAHRTVDDRPYGGGPGMVMKVEPLRSAIRAARAKLPRGSRTVVLSPQGRVFDQRVAREYAALPALLLVAGRYEGMDERVVRMEADETLTVGDYVLSGGEIPAMLVVDAVARLVPGVLGDEDSALEDSFSDGLLDCPHYTRPEEVDGLRVPPVLLSGDHAAIRRWRLQQALGRTWSRRPDLLAGRELTQEEQGLLEEYIAARETDGAE
ncbi:tRNA (guanosine(37)-N1)-methyltransferase TrmD [Thioalkalivibrio sp. XN279]|uniref:tRNA (guanosine(37)-N1)-methyltransferase TrmD n=1 Tax=Thioalkalivibrio sp. XN279 TaxID=2714953 RepID=UPI00140A2D57|nr:tRNA (guanosine(37)-N1)-methyltransferase TrmD [Thioalkalivibrio sp. XN279]NHA14745.1 tRNA (guanosine(37)-N1)-methyltransferase TrmD [Thioalkalivibrio sp. XN279]